jgi:hypothetical protein
MSISKSKWLELILFPLFVVNITTSANTWNFLGISIGQLFYYIIIIISSYIIVNTQYKILAYLLIILSLIFHFTSFFLDSFLLNGLKTISLGGIFVLVGGKIYGENPSLLYKQLIFFFLISIPFMICQMTGISSVFMLWNTDYSHSIEVLDISEIGTFKFIPVYPTLFVGLDELNYQIGQGRPSGLLNANNILSIFVLTGIVLNIITAKTAKLRLSDFIVICILVITMSFMNFFGTLLVYSYCIFFGGRIWRVKSLKLLIITSTFLSIYYLFFPGLFEVNFGESKLLMSTLTRGLDIANALGLYGLNDIFSDEVLLVGHAFSEDSSYSQISLILKSEYFIALILGILFIGIFYLKRCNLLKKQRGTPTRNYDLFLFCLIFSQFAIPYIEAPSFQFILGYALYPLMQKFWSVKV